MQVATQYYHYFNITVEHSLNKHTTWTCTSQNSACMVQDHYVGLNINGQCKYFFIFQSFINVTQQERLQPPVALVHTAFLETNPKRHLN